VGGDGRVRTLVPPCSLPLRGESGEGMKPTKVIEDRFAALLATDTTTIAAVGSAPNVHLIKEAFVPSRTTDFLSMEEAGFTGGGAKAATAGNQQSFTDPVTGNTVVQLLEPVGGWHWQATVAPASPQTIYGWCVTDNADAVTYGSDLFDDPPIVTSIGDAVDIPFVRYSIPLGILT